MSTIIKPTVGRVVWYHPSPSEVTAGFTHPQAGEPLPAIVARVVDDRCVSLAVFDAEGATHSRPYVPFVQEGEDLPPDGCYAEWMPYQIGQAKKHAIEPAGTESPKLTGTDTSDAAIEQEIVAKGKTAPRVTPADIEANIASEHYFTAAQGATNRDAVNSEGWQCAVPKHLELLTFCVLVLQNGFTVTGESACASPENFDAEIGRKVARENAVQKIWPLMGYLLKDRLHNAA